jgi:sugar phosphate isomerase/epimerase
MNALDRLSVSGICTNRLSLEEDLQFWRRHGITTAGIPRRKLSPEGVSLLRESAIRVTSLLGFGPALDDRSTWTVARSQLRRMFSEAQEIGAETLVITTGPAGSLRWEEAADALATFLEPLGAWVATRCDWGGRGLTRHFLAGAAGSEGGPDTK